jgi:hypothetical protein
MKCDLKECYWNMWNPKHKMFNNDDSMVCVSEDLAEHFDESNVFKLLPNNEKCPSYKPYIKFCGMNKEDACY